MNRNQEIEYLKLAGIYLACRWEIMGNIVGSSERIGDPISLLHFAFLGLHDYEREMELLIKEMK